MRRDARDEGRDRFEQPIAPSFGIRSVGSDSVTARLSGATSCASSHDAVEVGESVRSSAVGGQARAYHSSASTNGCCGRALPDRSGRAARRRPADERANSVSSRVLPIPGSPASERELATAGPGAIPGGAQLLPLGVPADEDDLAGGGGGERRRKRDRPLRRVARGRGLRTSLLRPEKVLQRLEHFAGPSW